MAVVDDFNLNGCDERYYQREKTDYVFEVFKSSGPGGQNRNKVSSGIKCIHIPTGIKQERTLKCQHANRKQALDAVNQILDSMIHDSATQRIQDQRTSNIGSGERGDKIRIYKFQNGVVIDGRSGKQIPLKLFFKGKIDMMWE